MSTQFGSIGVSGLSAADVVSMRACAYNNQGPRNLPAKPVVRQIGKVKTSDEYFRDTNTDVWGEPFFGSIGKDRFLHLRERKYEGAPKENTQ